MYLHGIFLHRNYVHVYVRQKKFGGRFKTRINLVRKRIAKVTDFLSFCPFGISVFPFLTIGISMYQNNMLPYFIITSTFLPQAYSLLERSR